MKVLFIGGTGTISSAISRRLVAEGHELVLLNRGNRNDVVPGARYITVDVGDEKAVSRLIAGSRFDAVADFIGFVPAQIERDLRLFKDSCGQYLFISSASAYQKPLSDYRVSEATPLSNPFWEYSRNKIACEEVLMRAYRDEGFPVTIVRPSHTYDERSVPLGVHGAKGSWQVIQRMRAGKPVIIHGDGTSLWTMTHARDFAGAFIGLLGNLQALGESVQITSDETLSWNQIYQAIANALAVELKAVHVASEFLARCSGEDFTGSLVGDKANSVVFDNSKLKRLVPGWTATIRFDQGVRETIAHVLANPALQIPDPDFDAWSERLIGALDAAAKAVIK